MSLSLNLEQLTSEFVTEKKHDSSQIDRLSSISARESTNHPVVAKISSAPKSDKVIAIIPKPSKKGLSVQRVQILPPSLTTIATQLPKVDLGVTAKNSIIDDNNVTCVHPAQTKAGSVSLVVSGDSQETGNSGLQSTNFPQRPPRKRLDRNPLPDQLLLSRRTSRTENAASSEARSHAEKRAMGSPTNANTNTNSPRLIQTEDSATEWNRGFAGNQVVLRNNNWDIPHQKAEKSVEVRDSAVFSFTLQPAFHTHSVHAGKNKYTTSKKNEHKKVNPGLLIVNTRPSSPVLSLTSTPAPTAPAPHQQDSPPGGLEVATSAVLNVPIPETNTASSPNKIKVTIPVPLPLRFNIQSLSYDSSSGSSRVQPGGQPSAVPSLDASDDTNMEASFRQHVLDNDYLMQLRFLSSQTTDENTPRAVADKHTTPKTSQIPSNSAPVSYRRQELVMPTMPTSHRPSPQHRGMGVVTRRNLALRSANHFHAPQTSLQAAVVGHGGNMDEVSDQGSMLMVAKRAAVSDSLNGARTAVTKGGLFQQNDFFELMKGSTEISAVLNLQEEEFPSMITKLSPVSAKERKAPVRIGRPVAEESPSPERVLDPATLAAIEAARKSADAARMPHVMTPASALESFGHLLTELERAEILHFPRVYFLGLSVELKVRVGGHPEVNNGYDYKDGLYITHFGDHLRYRYELLSTLGKGSFGKVYRCRDHKLGIDVAVKVIKNLPIFSDQALMELETLKTLLPASPDTPDLADLKSSAVAKTHLSQSSAGDTRHHHFMVQLVDHFEFRSHKCFVFPIFGKNLYEYMRDRDFAGLPMSFVKKVASQLLAALTHLKSLNILHCDIKPENILMRDETTAAIVLIDFGSSCRSTETTFTYIQSRFYRSPEVLLGMSYGFNIDLWSVAAILPELRTSYPAFPGESGADQLACIADVLGLPPASMYERCTRKERYFSTAGVLQVAASPRGMARLPNSRSLDMITNARRKDADFVDFLSQCLRWEPETRLSLEGCMTHPWLSDQLVFTSQLPGSSTPSTQFASRGDTPIRADSTTLQDEEETVRFVVNAPAVSHLSMHQPDPMKGLTEDDMIRKIKISTSKAVQEEEDELQRQFSQLVG